MFSENRHSKIAQILVYVLTLAGVFAVPPAANAAGACHEEYVSGSWISRFSAGDGTAGAPFQILDRTDLLEAVRCASSSTTGLNFLVMNDIDLGGSANPWPYESDYFRHNLSGVTEIGGVSRSPVISNLYINESQSNLGFIANVGGGAVFKNLNLTGQISNAANNGLTGGLIGKIDTDISGANGNVLIENVTVSVDVETTLPGSAGGMIGFFGDSSNNGGTLTVTGSSVVYADGLGLITTNASQAGGLLGYARNGSKVIVSDSVINNVLIDTRSGASFGGVIGGSTNVSAEIIRTGVSSVLLMRAETDTSASYVGGLIGFLDAGTHKIQQSYFDGLINFRGKGYVGGLVSSIAGDPTNVKSLQISDTYASGTIVRDNKFSSNNSSTYLGGLAGYYYDEISITDTIINMQISAPIDSKKGSVFGASHTNTHVSSGNLFVNTALEAASTSSLVGFTNNSSNVFGSTLVTSAQLADSANFSGYFNASTWGYCSSPYLLWEGIEGCSPRITGAVLTPAGNSLEVYFSVPVNPSPNTGDRYPSNLVFTVEIDDVSASLASPIEASSTSRSVLLPLPSVLNGEVVLAYSYLDPTSANDAQDVAMEAQYGSQEDVRSRSLILGANSSVAGPQASLGSPTPAPTEISIPLDCSGNCGPADSYTYVASITPAGGATTTISGTATSATTTLSFTALSPNVAHNIQASVTYNGQTSATASTTITTPRPIATISSVVVSETTATLDIGCTNCGAAPDSYTISATPQAGGSAITSNTAVISGLSSETTYSFAVVISYAGTTSASVNWQDNPVRTLPYSPVITSVTPSSAPLSGGSVSVTGTNFSTSDQLTFGGSNIAFTIVDGNTITFTAPSATAGAVDLAIRNEVGTGSLPNAFTYVPGPSLTTNSPFVATTNGGTIVTLTGTDLSTATQVNLGSSTVSVTVVSSTKVRFVTPATTDGVVDVGIVTVGGIATLSQALEFTTSALVPVVTSITPTSGTTAGGTTITVTGQYFSGSYSDSVSAAINGVSGSSIVLVDDSTLTFVSPAGIAAIGLDITVLTGGGLGTLAGAFSYIAPVISSGGGTAPVTVTTPEILDFSTRELTIQGGTVTISGKRLAGIVFLMVGGKAATISSNTDVAATFILGELPIGVWNLELRNEYGNLTFQEAFTVVATSYTTASGGTLLGYQWTLKFLGNSRTLSAAQAASLDGAVSKYDAATTIVCWGYTTASEPNAWAIAHATARAKAACDYLSDQMDVKAVIRLRYGVEKSYAMRSAIQFWK